MKRSRKSAWARKRTLRSVRRATKAQYEKVQSYYQLAKEEGAIAAIGGELPGDETAQERLVRHADGLYGCLQ